MATQHYNFTEIDGSAPINIETDVNTPLNEIDAAIYNLSGNVGEVSAAVDDLEDHFPIETNDIASGAVNYAKLAADVFSGIFDGMAIYHFNNEDVSADNTGMVVPEGCVLEGYYIPELTLLAVTRLLKPPGKHMGGNGTPWTDTGWTMPTYVPRPQTSVQFPFCPVSNGSDIYADWTVIKYRSDGHIGVNSTNDGEYFTGSPFVLFMRPFIS